MLKWENYTKMEMASGKWRAKIPLAKERTETTEKKL